MVTDVAKAKEKHKDYWYSWTALGGNSYEGVILEIEDDAFHVLCTDGVKRATDGIGMEVSE